MGLLRNLVLAAVFAVTTAHAEFAFSGTRRGVAGGLTARTFASPNGAVQLTLEEMNPTPMKYHDVDILASVWKQVGESKEILWTARYTGGSIQFLASWDVCVSDDGDFFLLTVRNGNELMLYRKDAALSLQAAHWGGERRKFLSFSEYISVLDTLNGQKIVRVWDRDGDTWHAFNVVDGKKIGTEPPMIGKWNDALREEILDKLAAAERERLRQKVTRLPTALRKIATTAMGTNSTLLREIEYEFLTWLRNPDDRKWIEALLCENDLTDWRRIGGGSTDKDFYTLELTDLYKVRADWLLGIWDNKVQRNMAPENLWGKEGKLPRFALGKVGGRVRFATPVNLFFKQSSGVFHLRLLRADDAHKANAMAEAELAQTIPNQPQPDEELVDEIAFSFTTVRPGNYVLKAIWNKRAPFANTNSAGPGDYESAFSKMITVTAGNVVSNVIVYCTNRVAGGESYYAMDEAIRKRWKETGEYARFTFAADKDGAFDTFSRNAPLWILRTNVVEATNAARVTRIGLRTWKKPSGTQIARPDTLVVQLSRHVGEGMKKLALPGDLKIFDEHGCVYENKYFTEWKDSATYTFFSFPRSDASWRLVGYGPTYNAALTNMPVAFDYTITNLVRIAPMAETNVVGLPRVLDLGPVTMTVSKVTEQFFEPEIEATFAEGLAPDFTWAIQEAYAVDRHGNFMRPRAICREEKSFRVVGRAQNVQTKSAGVPFEFAVRRDKK